MTSTEILVDLQDAGLLKVAWNVSQYGDDLWYAARWESGKTIYLHREIMKAGPGDEVDHRNGNGLDNRRSNLRVTTHRLNLANQRIQRRTKSSRFKGVSFYRSRGLWEAYIKVDGRARKLGYFLLETEAAAAYNTAALAAWGAHARLNQLEVA